MAVQVKGIALVQGSRDFNVKGIQVVLIGPTPNNTLPLVDPVTAGGAGPVVIGNHGAVIRGVTQ